MPARTDKTNNLRYCRSRYSRQTAEVAGRSRAARRPAPSRPGQAD
jgi:hypothetical protein